MKNLNIERNLGNVERLVRLLVGVMFLLWAVTQPYMNGIEWLLVAVSAMLILNGVFSRCYVWYVLDINTCNYTASKTNKSAVCV